MPGMGRTVTLHWYMQTAYRCMFHIGILVSIFPLKNNIMIFLGWGGGTFNCSRMTAIRLVRLLEYFEHTDVDLENNPTFCGSYPRDSPTSKFNENNLNWETIHG